MLSEEFVKGVIKGYPFAEGRVAFDIGAHHGDFTELLAEKFEKVYAFEPFPDNIEFLKKRFADNPKVVIVEKAVHRKNGTERFFVNGITEQGSLSKMYSSIRAWQYTEDSYIEVETITIDSFVENEGITVKDIGLMKIDVEGAEQYVFQGALETLSEYAQAYSWIILECHLLVDWDFVTDMLKSLQYTFVDTDLKQVEQLQACNHYMLHKGIVNFA